MATYNTIYDMIAGRVSGVYVSWVSDKSTGIPQPVVRGGIFLVDGAPNVPLESIRPQDVEQIDVLSDVSIVSFAGSDARKVLNILTKRGSGSIVQNFDMKGGQQWQGYSIEREFYSPKYIIPKSNSNSTPDLRATLYWHSNLKTDKEGKATITFYNSDIAKKLRITIEGTDGKGNVGSFQTVVE
jgi:hypothetical protein